MADAKRGPNAKLSSADYVRIKAMIAQGCADVQIAKAFGVSRSTINRVRHYLLENEPAPENPVLAFMQRQQERKATHERIFAAYHADCEGNCTADHPPCNPELVAELRAGLSE